jgi:transcriptional regulator
MSYLIKVAAIDIILSLRRRGWSQRRIASKMDINRETVALMFGQPATPLRLGRSRKPW